jgi:ADP-ribose pyrophosphatase
MIRLIKRRRGAPDVEIEFYAKETVRGLAKEADKIDADKLGEFFSSPGVFTEVIHLFLARDLQPVPPQPEDHEVFEARWIPLADACALAGSAQLHDAKSLVGLFWAQETLRQR